MLTESFRIVKTNISSLQTSRTRAYGALLLGVGSIAFSAMFVRWADVPGVVSGFYRQVFALVALTPLYALRLRGKGGSESKGKRRTLLIAMLAGLFFAADIGLWSTSVFYTSAANATLLANTAPVHVGLGAMLLFRERPGFAYWLGLLVALLGAALIIGADLRQAAEFGLGDLLALIAGAAYGYYILAISWARQRSMSVLSAAWLTSGISGLVLLIVSVALGHTLAGFTLRQWLAMIGAGVLSQALGYICINYALGKLSAPLVSATLLGQPVLTAVLAIPLLNEQLSPAQIVGGLVTLLGIYLVNRGKLVKPAEAEMATTASD